MIGFDFGIGELAAGALAADAATTAAGVGTAAATTAAAAGTAAAAIPAATALGSGFATSVAGAEAAGLFTGAATAATAAAPLAVAGGATAAGAAGAGSLLSASTISEIGIGTSLASGALGALGSVRTAEAQKDAANYQAQVDLNNQKLSSYYANTAAAKGSVDLQQEQLKSKQQMDLIRASQAASGVDVASGSSEDVRHSQEILNNLDALTIMNNTAQQYYGYEVQGASSGNQAGLQQLQATQAGPEAALGATSSLVSGASGAANQYLNWMRVAGGPSATGLVGNG